MSDSIAPAVAETTAPAVEGITNAVPNNIAADVIETSVPVVEVVTDAELIAVAKDLNVSAQFHLRKSVEEFWKLGEALSRLSERPSVKGRWREVLKEIGINHTTDNQARRLFAATTLKKLAGYRNKTAALRALGILAEPTPVKKETPDRSSKSKTKAAPVEAKVAVSDPGGVPPTDILAEEPMASPTPDIDEIPAGEIIAGGEAVEIITGAEAGEGTDRNKAEGRRPEPAPAEMLLDPLTKLTRLASNLEYLAADEFDLSVEFVAQIERAKKALDFLLGKGAFHAAA